MAVLPQVCFNAGLKLLPSMLLLGNGHVVGAVNVPLDQLTAAVKAGQLPAAQEPIALICQSGRCAKAAGKLACCWQQALDAEQLCSWTSHKLDRIAGGQRKRLSSWPKCTDSLTSSTCKEVRQRSTRH